MTTKKVNALSNETLEQLKLRLVEKLDNLKKRRESLVAEDPFADPDRLNDNAAVDAEAAEQFGHERTEAMLNEVERSIEAVEAALAAIDDGTYGKCKRCKKQIETERLMIEPTAELCIECQKATATEESER